jgi:hypothetical protein
LEERGDPGAEWLRLDVQLANGRLAGRENAEHWLKLLPHKPPGVSSLYVHNVAAVFARTLEPLARALASVGEMLGRAIAGMRAFLENAQPLSDQQR